MSKYHAIKTVIDGVTFASKAEATRYNELKLLARNGYIDRLVLQPVFQIIVNEKKICKYIADFSYYDEGKYVVEDVKGMKTPVYRLKKRLVEAQYGIVVTEVTS